MAYSRDDASSNESKLCQAARQVTIPAPTQTVVLARSRAHDHRDAQQCLWTPMSTTPPGLLHILSGVFIYVYIFNRMTTQTMSPKLMSVAKVSSAHTYIIHVTDEGPHMLTYLCSILTQCNKFYSNSTINAVRYKLPEPWDEQGNHHNAVDQSEKISKTEWLRDPILPEDYSKYSDIFINMTIHLDSKWEGHLGSIRVGQPRIKISKTDSWPIHSTPYCAGPQAREFKNQEINRVLANDVIEHTKQSGPQVFFLFLESTEILRFALTSATWRRRRSGICNQYHA